MQIFIRNQGPRNECNQIAVLKTFLVTCSVCVSIAFRSDFDNYTVVEFMNYEKKITVV